MADILIDYAGMQDAQSKYTAWAEDLRSMKTAISNRNSQLVSAEWNGQSAVAFQERFDSDHALAMEKVAAALDNIATFISNYIANQQNADSEQANAIR